MLVGGAEKDAREGRNSTTEVCLEVKGGGVGHTVGENVSWRRWGEWEFTNWWTGGGSTGRRDHQKTTRRRNKKREKKKKREARKPCPGKKEKGDLR